MLKLQALICADPVALEKWPIIVEHIVQSATDKLRIKTLFTVDRKYGVAILETLNSWNSYGNQRVNLLKVLRSYELETLADKIVAEGALPAATKPQQAQPRHSGVWFEVGDVIYNFTGRESELYTVHEMLTSSHGTKSAAANIASICGLGGIGKSSLAREYAHRYRAAYDGNVMWINAETADSMKISFLRLAERLGLGTSGQESNEVTAKKVYEIFQGQKSLFIFDNVEEESHFQQVQPKKIENPSKHTPYILVTTRLNDLVPLAENQLILDVLALDESVKLIKKQLPYTNEEWAKSLAEALQRLPLTLQQALAYIKEKFVSDGECISKYLREFQRSEQKLLDDERFKRRNDYSMTTYATWNITLTRIKTMEGGESARQAIEVLAYLNPDLITAQFVRNIFDCQDLELGLKLLERFSMIRTNTVHGKIEIHRLLQKVIRMSLSSEEEVNVLKPLIKAIAKQFGRDEFTDYTRECMSHGLHLFPDQLKQTELMKGKSTYMCDLCYFLNNYGDYSDALLIAEQSSAAYESMLGVEHEDTIRMKWRTAGAHFYLKNYSRATEILESILPVSKSKLGKEHWLTMNILESMARVHTGTGDYQKAISIYDEIIPVRIRLFGKNHDNVLIAKENKAKALRELGKLNESLELLQDVYDKRVELHGKNDPRTLHVRESIGLVFDKKGNYGKAIEIWTEVYQGRLKVLGETHPEVIQVKKWIDGTKHSPSGSRSWCRLQ